MMTRIVILAGIALLAGCYTYAPMDASRLQPGASVRMRINAQTAEHVEPLLGRTDARQIAGTVIMAGVDTLIVEVPTTTQLAGSRTFQTLNQRVSIPRTGLLELESRTLNRTRTWLVTGAAAVIVGAIILNATVEGGSNQGGNGGGPPELTRRGFW